ncbi:MAG: hypothetical protein ACWA5P_03120 [bacterium]
MKISFFVLTFFMSLFLNSQNLYLLNERSEEEAKTEGKYYPDHNVTIQKFGNVYHNDELIFQPPLKEIYYYFYELFEDKVGNQFIIATQVFHDQNDFASVYNVNRKLLFIISLKEGYPIYFTKLNNGIYTYDNGLSLVKQESFEYYGGGNRVKKIDTENMKFVVLCSDDSNNINEREFELYKFNGKL